MSANGLPPRVLAFGSVLCFIAAAIVWYLQRGPARVEGIPVLVLDDDVMAEDETLFAVAATQRFGAVEVPWPFAPITVEAGDARIPLFADAGGRVALDLNALWTEARSPEALTLVAGVSWEGRSARTEPFALTRAELEGRVDARASRARAVAFAAAEERDWRRAAGEGQVALSLRPEDGSLWALFAEAAAEEGRTVEALAAYREALRLDDGSLDEEGRRALRERAVVLAASLGSEAMLGPTADALELLRLARESGDSGEYRRAWHLAVAAQDASPWWVTAYDYAGAMAVAEWVRAAEGGSEVDPPDSWDLVQALALGSDDAGALLVSTQDRLDRLERVRAAAAAFEAAVQESGLAP